MFILNLFSSLFSRGQQPTSAENTAKPSSSASSPRRGGSYALPITGSAHSVATVYCCVDFLSDSVANLPLQVLRQKDGIFIPDTTNRLHYLLNVQPNPSMSAVDFWKQVIIHKLLRGNAYILPIYSTTILDIDRLVLLSPDTVSYNTTNGTYTVHSTDSGLSGDYGEDEIIHIKNFSLDGKKGLSTLSYARTTLDIALTGDKETLNRFSNGGNVRGIVSNDTSVRGFGEYQDNELAKTATDLDDRFRMGERIVSLPGQVQFNPLSLSSTDMQFLESRKFTVREICRFFRVHPSFVFDDTSNNYKSAENANVAFLSTTLNPMLRQIENELLRKLVAPELSSKRKFSFDRKGLYAADLESKVKYQNQTIAAGLYTVNEWRQEENKPAVDGGDTVLVSANLRGINETNATTKINNNDGNEEQE